MHRFIPPLIDALEWPTQKGGAEWHLLPELSLMINFTRCRPVESPVVDPPESCRDR